MNLDLKKLHQIRESEDHDTPTAHTQDVTWECSGQSSASSWCTKNKEKQGKERKEHE